MTPALQQQRITAFSGWPTIQSTIVPAILPRSQDMLAVVEETTGLYGICRASLERYRCRIGCKPYIHTVSKFEAVDINTEEDLLLRST